MKMVAKGIGEWSCFSEEKQMNFNGHFLEVGEHRLLIDPPPFGPTDLVHIQHSGAIDYIVITNRDHLRNAVACKQTLKCQLFVPEADAWDMEVKPDKTFKDGELLPGGIWVVTLQDQKSQGESALFLQQGKGILIVGDAILGTPAGKVSLLPAEKYADHHKAHAGLLRLLNYQFDTLLVGDGESILTGAHHIVAQALT